MYMYYGECLMSILNFIPGADAPTYLALLPPKVESPRGDYVWFNREIIDWVNGPVPAKC